MKISVYFLAFALFLMVDADEAVTNSSCVSPNKHQGQCVPLFKCQSLTNLVRTRPMTSEIATFLAESHCGWVGNSCTYPRVCCSPDPGPAPTPKPPGPVPRSKLPIPGGGKCGIDSNDRILGGEVTKIDEFPWLSLLAYTLKENKTLSRFMCGGSLISDRHVLTAAHCVANEQLNAAFDLTFVRLGEWEMETEPDCDTSGVGENCAPMHIDVPVKKITHHELYEPKSKHQHHDIALIELAEPVKLSDFVFPICLPTTPEMRNDTVVEGKKFVVAGWGSTETEQQSSSKLKVGVDGVTNEHCDKLFTKLKAPVTEKQLCAGGVKGKDSCRGDSGGPLMTRIRTKNNTFTYLAGVVSFGQFPCGKDGWPGVYTRTASYIDWIESKM